MLFNALASAKFTHKYEVVWAELPSAEFNTRTKAWFKTNFTQLQAWKQMEALPCFKANKEIPDVVAL